MSTDLQSFVMQHGSFSSAELRSILACFRPRTLRKSEAFVREGDTCQHLAFIQQGVLRIFYRAHGQSVTRYLGTEPSFITSLRSFTTQCPAPETIEALEDSRLLVIHRRDMQQLCCDIHAWESFYRTVLEQMFICVEDRIREFITLTAEHRYEILCRERPGLLQRVPQKYIASYIGIKPQSLSRLQKMAYERDKLTNVNNTR